MDSFFERLLHIIHITELFFVVENFTLKRRLFTSTVGRLFSCPFTYEVYWTTGFDNV